ncbi:uncharacterized protein LOC115929575 [Strongylocentrotus purpuratus]|uniref:Uncharacterized protein n=1 Tax=Strongylocentrotus purpuratus TaxID=7668 RepID=A0A7M7T590_STRPU|nr:uncharacterized protein LOC115929575 [Strongylocentrotus purpuratus]
MPNLFHINLPYFLDPPVHFYVNVSLSDFSPYISGSREDIFKGRNIYYLVIEGSVVNDGIATFREAVITLFCCFYALSLEYPPEGSVTMEFIQRELIGISPGGPVKSGGKKKKKSAVSPKIIALLRGIVEFESDWKTE